MTMRSSGTREDEKGFSWDQGGRGLYSMSPRRKAVLTASDFEWT
jgi:hypothetical protein